MRRQTQTWILGLVLSAGLCSGYILLRPTVARACVPLPDASGVTDMNSRRAVIWIRQQTFQIVFQNRYKGSAKDFAWLIPLPGVPTHVDSPSDKFLEELDRFTAPMIESQSCHISCSQGYPDAGAIGTNVPPPSVTVWGTGKLGDVDYQILSASTSKDLIDWLTAGGFSLPSALGLMVDSYLKQGFTFFAGKVAASVGSIASVPPVRFTFDRTKTPIIYPMRISAFNLSTHLETVIWVIAADGTYLPKNYPVALMSGSEYTETSYQTALDKATSAGAGTTFAVQYASRPASSSSYYDYQRRHLHYMYGTSSMPEMDEILSAKENPYVVRLKARLNPNGMTKDLTLQKTAQPKQLDGWYLTPCPGGITHDKCDGGSKLPPDGGVPNPQDPNDPAGQADQGGCHVAGSLAGRSLPAPLCLLVGLALLGLALRRGRS